MFELVWKWIEVNCFKLVDVQYSRNDIDFQRGTFRVRGDVVEIFPASREEMCIRVEFLAMKLIEFELII